MADNGIINQDAPPVEAVEPPPAGVVPGPLEYPDSDGRFLPEHPLQANAIVELRGNLKQHFRDRADAVVEGDMFLYYAEGQADERLVRGMRVGKYVAPDVIVVLDHDLGGRGTYKLWEEGKPPDFALDVISPSSEVRDQQTERDLYARIRHPGVFRVPARHEARWAVACGLRIGEIGLSAPRTAGWFAGIGA